MCSPGIDTAGILVEDAASTLGISATRARGDRRRPIVPPSAKTFQVSLRRMHALEPTVRYRVYVFPRTRYLAGAEVLGATQDPGQGP